MNSISCLFVYLIILVSGIASASESLNHGDSLPRILLPEGYSATVFSTGISGADGLVFSSSGFLHAVSESQGVVYRIDYSGNAVVIADSLRNPEGIASDDTGSIYVTEDVKNGRLIVIEPTGEVAVLADSLQYPEGVVWMDDGSLIVTESSLEAKSLPPFQTGLLRIYDGGSSPIFSSLYLWSCSDLVADGNGILYVCNELSGYLFVQASLLRIDPVSGDWSVLCTGLHSCEGICFGLDGEFPLYVAEEDLGEGSGRISTVSEDGTVSSFARGFHNIEDVVVDSTGGIYVSEDSTGMIILIRKDG